METAVTSTHAEDGAKTRGAVETSHEVAHNPDLLCPTVAGVDNRRSLQFYLWKLFLINLVDTVFNLVDIELTCGLWNLFYFKLKDIFKYPANACPSIEMLIFQIYL